MPSFFLLFCRLMAFLPALFFLLFPLPAAANEPLRVALVLEHAGGDGGWTDSLLAGLRRAAETLPVQATPLIPQPGADAAALEALFRQAAQENDLVLVASDRLHEILRNNAANFRRTMFGCIDAGIRAPNIMSITFADEQAAFLAGAAAAMLTTAKALPDINADKTLGWVSGEDVPALRSLFNGFKEGARLVDPEVRVIQAVSGSFADAAAGGKAAQSLLDQGADVLVLAAGLGNGPALAAVKARNAYMVGMDADQRARFPGHVLTSVLKHGDAAVYDLIAAAASGKFQGKKILVRDLANGGVDITDPAVFSAAAGTGAPPDLQRRVQELRGEVLRGGVRLPSMRARTLCDCL